MRERRGAWQSLAAAADEGARCVARFQAGGGRGRTFSGRSSGGRHIVGAGARFGRQKPAHRSGGRSAGNRERVLISALSRGRPPLRRPAITEALWQLMIPGDRRDTGLRAEEPVVFRVPDVLSGNEQARDWRRRCGRRPGGARRSCSGNASICSAMVTGLWAGSPPSHSLLIPSDGRNQSVRLYRLATSIRWSALAAPNRRP